ncbi:ribosome biogenesis protein BMS1 homolog [Anoplophora glabripennis]|nr:ribosome biogenesis protein BMS1 homolog [Anoplophora glabripennis]
MEENNVGDTKKSHRDRHSGRKAVKKKNKKDIQNPIAEELSDKQRNPKAFAFNSAIRAERRFRRKQDIETKKQHIPVVDRTPIEPPPILVAVVGPPKVGKTTLIKNLIKSYTRSPLTEIKGPVTIVTGKKRRVTFIECNNDINSMIDLAKVGDLVLLLCDASFGFEMEVFEFLNICQIHGMPRIMGVLTHLDMIKNSKALKTTKKTLKHRFWAEVYPGAKLFYLSGILHGEYLRNEIKNLSRFISVMKFRPLQWRTTHSYLLGDRYEDLTNQELIRKNPKCDRNISLYGYIRGVPLKKETAVHIAGLGDLKICDISCLPDPCPLPEQIKKRALIEKEKFVYAPFSGVGGIVYDKDAVYIELGGSHSHSKRTDDETSAMIANLLKNKTTLDVKLEHSKIQLFTGGDELTAKDLVENEQHVTENVQLYEKRDDEKEDSDLDAELKELRKENIYNFHEERVENNGRIRRKVVFDTTDEDYSNNLSDNSEDEYKSSDNDEDGIKEVVSTSFEYTNLRVNKDKDIHDKVSSVLKQLSFKETTSGKEDGNKSIQNSKEVNEESTSEANGIFFYGEINLVSNDKDNNEGSDSDEHSDKHEESSEESNSEQDSESDENLEDNNEDSEDNSDVYGMDVKWKENLAQKAKDSFVNRQNTNHNIMKLVYGVFDSKHNFVTQESESSSDDEDNIGGLFKKVSRDQEKLKLNKDSMNLTESSLMLPWGASTRDWLDTENKALIANCFVTGKWKESEDAAELLKLDDTEDLSDVNSEIFGDFEDLETGQKFETSKLKTDQKQAEKRKRKDSEKDEEADKQALVEKKRKLKEKFDAEYDNTEKTSYYDDLKMTAEKQAQLNKTVFDSMPDEVRVQIEGFRAGMYVRIEFENVPAEFITNFDPTYPLVIGALNMGEENIGYVNVRIKKHRWYNKILKTNDPLIISLGWRRFQTIPLYSKLEDDLKYRYLKYTPEHLACNAHFWGPITPQGTGFLALQVVDSSQEVVKKLGFRIAATGTVQELDKSTQIMKKLKLIGYPLKIYKKTAFVKGMFNSALEVAKFEGARIKTVSGIRGQIKKAVNKPEGCFRATFEDKIQLSDIVFCRTWYRVDVPEFYAPVNTLLLPSGKKNAWRGIRTTGEIKREEGIKNPAHKDSLYTPINRQPKPFKPLIIPQKLQKALPYRDKPNHGIKVSERKKGIDRVAVIREPHEQKVSAMIKMIKATYEHKQEKLKKETKERLEKHRQNIAAQEASKERKLKQKKKEVFRNRSKAQIREKNKGGGK